MERYIGIVTAVSGQRAKVRIERGLKKGEKPRILDCWNTCEAKKRNLCGSGRTDPW